jgi:chromosomal replication initiation ATPase DnaA
MNARQLPLDLPHRPSYAEEDFLAAPANAAATRAVGRWPGWAGRMLVLTGPPGSGKTHLATIWARRAAAATILADAPPETWPAPDAAHALLIENADRIGPAEAQLFHALNIAREHGASVLITGRTAPDTWGIRTADLLSRLRLAPLAALGEPDEALAFAVLFKLFSDRQLSVDPAIIGYVAARIERSLGAARAIVEAIDREALAQGRPVTRALAARVVGDADIVG